MARRSSTEAAAWGRDPCPCDHPLSCRRTRARCRQPHSHPPPRITSAPPSSRRRPRRPRRCSNRPSGVASGTAWPHWPHQASHARPTPRRPSSRQSRARWDRCCAAVCSSRTTRQWRSHHHRRPPRRNIFPTRSHHASNIRHPPPHHSVRFAVAVQPTRHLEQDDRLDSLLPTIRRLPPLLSRRRHQLRRMGSLSSHPSALSLGHRVARAKLIVDGRLRRPRRRSFRPLRPHRHRCLRPSRSRNSRLQWPR